jgi:hypothetical protein
MNTSLHGKHPLALPPVFWMVITMLAIVSACTPDNNSSGDEREKFLGSWTCKDSSITNGDVQPIYTVTITKVGDNDSVRISNFYRLGSNTFVYAKISDKTLFIPSQNDDGFLISGSGSINNSSIKINYGAQLGSNTDQGIAIYQ